VISALFVYGPMLRDGSQAAMLGDRRRRPARTRGKLYDLPAGYPVLTGGSGEVFGELIEPVDERLLRLLDLYQGVSEGRMVREARRVHVDTTYVQAWMYLMDNPRQHGGRPVPSGRWRGARRR